VPFLACFSEEEVWLFTPHLICLYMAGSLKLFSKDGSPSLTLISSKLLSCGDSRDSSCSYLAAHKTHNGEEQLVAENLHSSTSYPPCMLEPRGSNPIMDLNLTCIQLAKSLLGKVVCRRIHGEILKGMIVETEAYVGPQDMACHTYGGRRTARNEAMYMKAGTCYVYIVYGMHQCFNISAAEDGAAVLVRALEPLEGVERMQIHRRMEGRGRMGIANGPAKLCVAMGITKQEINKEDLMLSSKIWLEDGRCVEQREIVASGRIGIRNAGAWGEKKLRFYIRGCEFVSCRKVARI
jgi:DNA-3-methyladenine glycosylase